MRYIFLIIISFLLINCDESEPYHYLTEDDYENGKYVSTDGVFVKGCIQKSGDVDYYSFFARRYKKGYDSKYDEFVGKSLIYQFKVKWVSGKNFEIKAKNDDMIYYSIGDMTNDIIFETSFDEDGFYNLSVESNNGITGEYEVSITENEYN